jgi:hypothetical protein
MKQELQLNPFKPKKDWKYKVITLTDITLHTADKKLSSSIGKKVKKSFKTNKIERIYSPSEELSDSKVKIFILDMLKKDPEFMKMVQEEEKKGYKILIDIPRELPLFPGKDTMDFINSKNGKRILRSLAKKSDKDI